MFSRILLSMLLCGSVYAENNGCAQSDAVNTTEIFDVSDFPSKVINTEFIHLDPTCSPLKRVVDILFLAEGIKYVLVEDETLSVGLLDFEFNITEEALPDSGVSFQNFYLVGNGIYAVNYESNQFYKWDDALESWVDLSTIKYIPIGDVRVIALQRDNLIVNVFNGVDIGVWYLGDTTVKLSDTSVEERSLKLSNYGLVQLDGNFLDGYVLNYLGSSRKAKVMPLEWEVTYYNVSPSIYGALYHFGWQYNYPALYWDSIYDNEDTFVQMPEISTHLRGCFNSKYEIYCAFNSNNEFMLFRLENAQLILDSLVEDDTLSDYRTPVMSVYSVGQSRFVMYLVNSNFELYEINEAGSTLLARYSNVDSASIINLDDPLVFYVRTASQSGLQLSKYTLDGEVEYVATYNGDKGGRKIEEGEFVRPPKAELSGAYSLHFILCLGLLTLLGRTRR